MREIARQCDLPESTLRLYRDEFEVFLPAVGEGKRRRYPEQSMQRLRLIASWKKEGRGALEIREELSRRKEPTERAHRRTQEERMDELVALVRAQGEQLAALRAEVGELRRERARRLDFDSPHQHEALDQH